jgi:hypothetical protein
MGKYDKLFEIRKGIISGKIDRICFWFLYGIYYVNQLKKTILDSRLLIIDIGVS